MNRHLMTIEIDDMELNAIMEELHAAEETIYKCYEKLRDLGVLSIKKEGVLG